MAATIAPRETLDRQLKKLKDDTLILGSMVEEATRGAVDALKRRDSQAAKRIYMADQHINAKRFEIENTCMVLIATQQPLARDLRILASTFEVANELERMGDYAKGIAKICVLMEGLPLVKPLVDIPLMAEITIGMLHRALSAYVDIDEQAAREIPKDDDRVDALYNQIFRELITFMVQDPATINRANYLIWVAHNLERMADRVTNICERTVYVATGYLYEIKASDDEQPGSIDHK
ncbi:MAG: phosphate signaling complex protein PhoU [Anaerolineales bacterium]|nr:phosphate signaling complex protein PhoU [Anaerolineales bacterium]